VRADKGRSLEAACDSLVALPAKLATGGSVSVSTLQAVAASLAEAEGGAAAAGPVDYLRVSHNAEDAATTLHYVGRAVEVIKR
jgi:hypothetical protein